MPQILVIADAPAVDGNPPVMFQERVTAEDFESDHFASQLIERIGWAVGDATERERHAAPHVGRRRRIDRTRSEIGADALIQRRSARLVTTAS